MTGPRSLVFVVLAAACQSGTGKVPSDPTEPYQTPPPTGTPPTTTVPTTPSGALSDLDARLHDAFGTLVIVSWTQDRPATVHAEFAGSDGVWLASPPRALEAGPHEEFLVGVPYEDTVTWRLVVEDASGVTASADQQIATAPWPATLPRANAPEVSEPALWDPAMPYVLLAMTEVEGDMVDPWWVMIIDRQARPIWAMRTSNAMITMHPHVALDGRSLLLDDNHYWGTFGSGGPDGQIKRMLLDGTVLETWDTPGLHHPFTELPDGTITYGRYSFPAYENEWLIEIAPDRTTRTVFDCAVWLGRAEDCGSNTITYRASTDSYLYSFFYLNTIFDIPRATGVPTRTFGEAAGSYAFDPPEAGMWYQHGGYWTDQGTLLSSTYALPGSPWNAPDDEETVVREYEVDEANQTLRLVWDFGVGDGVYGAQMGEAHRLPGGGVLHNLGTLARLREGTADGTVVWDVWWPMHDMGRSVPISGLYDFLPERP